MILTWNFFSQKMVKDYALMMQALNNTYLVSCKMKYTTYIVSWRLLYKSRWKGGEASSVRVTSLQRQPLL
jgi:hypothetical protein